MQKGLWMFEDGKILLVQYKNKSFKSMKVPTNEKKNLYM